MATDSKVTKEYVKEYLKNVVENGNGLKNVELICNIPSQFFSEIQESGINIEECLSELVEEKKIISVTYEAPNDLRTRDLYLPTGSTIEISGAPHTIKSEGICVSHE